MRNPYMKFQNSSMQGSEVMLVQSYKGPSLMKYFSEFIQKLIRSSTHQYQSTQIFLKGHITGKGHNPDGKNTCQVFFL